MKIEIWHYKKKMLDLTSFMGHVMVNFRKSYYIYVNCSSK